MSGREAGKCIGKLQLFMDVLFPLMNNPVSILRESTEFNERRKKFTNKNIATLTLYTKSVSLTAISLKTR